MQTLEEKLVSDGVKLFKVMYPLNVYLTRLTEIVEKNDLKKDETLMNLIYGLNDAIERYDKTVIDFWKLYAASSELYKKYYSQDKELDNVENYYKKDLIQLVTGAKSKDLPKVIMFLKKELDFKDVPDLYSILKRDKLAYHVNNAYIYFIDIFEKVHKIYSHFEKKKKDYLYLPLVKLENSIYSILGNDKNDLNPEVLNYCTEIGLKMHLISHVLELEIYKKFEEKKKNYIKK
ncbi:MAG: hypothetical protein QXS41_03715 [Candidatus Woesearchaeota archaeon]